MLEWKHEEDYLASRTADRAYLILDEPPKDMRRSMGYKHTLLIYRDGALKRATFIKSHREGKTIAEDYERKIV